MKIEDFQKFKNDYFQFTVNVRLNAFRDLNKIAEKGGVVFVGDSITEGFPIAEMLNSTKPLYNRGIAGDTALGVLNKLNDEVLDLAPCKVFLLVGTNDLGQGASSDEVLERIATICFKVRDKFPDTTIYVESIYPENKCENYRNPLAGDSPRTNELIIETNRKIEEMCKRADIIYLDVFSKLLDENGNLAKRYTYDGLHLTTAGYSVVCKVLENYL